MKNPLSPLAQTLGKVTLAAICLLSIPQGVHARDHNDDDREGRNGASKHRRSEHEHENHDRQAYLAQPKSAFTLTLGNGYAGQGYYYGPPNVSYHYERPEVKYYATRESAPREYRSRDSYRSRSGPAWELYFGQPRSGFCLTLGNGYAGRGYYYGPPNAAYYYERPEVRYYATREAAPREYYDRENYRWNSSGISVQRALARRGYYNGEIDGDIGPQSQRAIARFQEQNGMVATGEIDRNLLQSLGL